MVILPNPSAAAAFAFNAMNEAGYKLMEMHEYEYA